LVDGAERLTRDAIDIVTTAYGECGKAAGLPEQLNQFELPPIQRRNDRTFDVDANDSDLQAMRHRPALDPVRKEPLYASKH
jgi:hypothetical protein